MLEIGPLHERAAHEPVERGLDETRRATILELVTDLMDAVVSQRPRSLDTLRERGRAAVVPFLEADERVDQALLASMQYAIDMLRGRAPHPPGELAATPRAVDTRLEELRRQPDVTRAISDQEKVDLLVFLDARRMLFARQRAIEDAFTEWRNTKQGQAGTSDADVLHAPAPG